MSVKPTVLWLYLTISTMKIVSLLQRSFLRVEGCFDGFHYGHGNLLRQARNAVPGPVHVIAAVHSDAEILKNKGPPLLDEQERYSVVASCRWVDEVVADAPYSPQLAVLDRHGVDFVIHGNDTVKDASGKDIYDGVRQVGRFIECRRLDGVSTTDIIQSLLYPCTSDVEPDDTTRLRDLLDLFANSASPCFPIVDLTVASTIGTLPHLPDARTVYVEGSWDCFGSTHIEYLRRVHETAKGIEKHIGVVVIVGVWSDEHVQYMTNERPLLKMIERALLVFQCRFADALVLGPPRNLSTALCQELHVDCVVNNETADLVPGIKNIEVPQPRLQNLEDLRKIVLDMRERYEDRQRRKGLKDLPTN